MHQKGTTIPGCVGQSEAAPLDVNASVHHQLPEEQRRVPGRSTRGIFRGDPRRAPRGSCFGSGHEFNKPGQPLVLWNVLHFRLLRALCAQLAHGSQSRARGRSQGSPGLWLNGHKRDSNSPQQTLLQHDSFLACSAGVITSGPVLVFICLSESWACPCSLQKSLHSHTLKPERHLVRFSSLLEIFLLYT